MLSFAGLCDEDEYLILTTDALPALKKVHHRMPVVLQRDEESEWLNPDFTEVEQLSVALNVKDGLTFDFYPVSKIVNRADRDEPELIKDVS